MLPPLRRPKPGYTRRAKRAPEKRNLVCKFFAQTDQCALVSCVTDRARETRRALHLALDHDARAGRCVRDQVTVDGLAVDDEARWAALAAVLHVDAVLGAAAAARDGEAAD